MHCVRRSVFRAVTSSSLLKSRSIATATPLATSSLLKFRSIAIATQFAFRTSKPAATIQLLNIKRWNSNEAFDGEGAADSYAGSAAVRETAKDWQRPVIDPNPGIYVGNLSFELTPDDLRSQFEEFGKIVSVRLATDSRGLSKGFGYVEFENADQAAAAIAAKDQTTIDGRRAVVNYQAVAKPRPQQAGPSKTLFIGNLAFEMSDADLNKLFREIRNVLDVRVAIDRRTGQPRGFAHADFVDVESAQKAMEFLQGKEVYGRMLRVDFSSEAKMGRGTPRPRDDPASY